MLDLDHIVARGTGLMDAAGHLSRRLGFTLSRGESEQHLRIVLQEGYLDLYEQPEKIWHWSEFTLLSNDLMADYAALKKAGLSPRAPKPVGLGANGQPDHYEVELADISLPGTLPRLVQYVSPARPQDRMEPARAQAVVQHKNTASALSGVILLTPELGPVVDIYTRMFGVDASAPFENDVLGIQAQTIVLPSGKHIVIARASFGTGPAARFAEMYRSGLFAVLLQARDLRAAGDCMRAGGVFSYFNDDRLVTSSALPEFGALIMQQAPGS